MLRRSVELTVILGLFLFLVPLLSVPEGSEAVRENSGEPPEAETEALRDGQRTLLVEVGGEKQELTLEEYLVGVVAAEMPASFEPEALKAQTTAARTYTIYQMEHGSKGKHESGADLCDDPGCCQAYKTEEALRENWGAAAEENFRKIRLAEAETDGMVILYGGEPILAAFHSSSAEGTEDAAAAWSASVPYLQRVESPESEADVPNYVSEVSFTEEEFRKLFLAAYPAAELTGDASGWIGETVRDASGYVSTLTVGGVTLRGVELRRILGLRSACFRVKSGDGLLTFSTQGYGHGVGLSQYGANALAKEGKSWEEILRWYYTGVTVAPYGEKEALPQ